LRGHRSLRVHLVEPEEGLTGILLIESGKPTTQVPITAVDEKHFRQSRLLRLGAK
jgi:hypothetical protein